MPVVLYSGDKDLICNHFGTEALIRNLKWNGGIGWRGQVGERGGELGERVEDGGFGSDDRKLAGREAEGEEEEQRHYWYSDDGDLAGTVQSARNLHYVKFYNASHMVPFDHPRRARDMLHWVMGVTPELGLGLGSDGVPVDLPLPSQESEVSGGGTSRVPAHGTSGARVRLGYGRWMIRVGVVGGAGTWGVGVLVGMAWCCCWRRRWRGSEGSAETRTEEMGALMEEGKNGGSIDIQ